VIST
jgi:hypothetical protein